MSSSNCCFLTCIQISQESGQVVWYSHLFKNFPQFVVIHTVQRFGIVNKTEVDIFLELACLFNDPTDDGNLISGTSAFSKSSLNIWKFTVHVLLKPGLENFDSTHQQIFYVYLQPPSGFHFWFIHPTIQHEPIFSSLSYWNSLLIDITIPSHFDLFYSQQGDQTNLF